MTLVVARLVCLCECMRLFVCVYVTVCARRLIDCRWQLHARARRCVVTSCDFVSLQAMALSPRACVSQAALASIDAGPPTTRSVVPQNAGLRITTVSSLQTRAKRPVALTVLRAPSEMSGLKPSSRSTYHRLDSCLQTWPNSTHGSRYTRPMIYPASAGRYRKE